MWRLWILILLLPLGVQAAEVRIGILAWQGDQAAESQWTPLLDALQAALPGHRLQVAYHDLDGIDQALGGRSLDFIVTNPGHYVALEARHGASRIATQIIEPGQDSAHAVASAIVVASARQDLQQLSDLKGLRLAAVGPEAFGGYQVVWAELKRHGLDPERGDLHMQFSGFPMTRVLEAVASGQADAGVVRSCLLERLEHEGRLASADFRVLGRQEADGGCQRSSPVYPGWAFAAASQTSPDLARTVLIALLGLPPARTGQRWGVPADYHPVHEMLRELQIMPYEFLREHRLESQIRRYWPLAAGLALFLMLWVYYTLRVEVLVQRRTRELSEALASGKRLADSIQVHRQQMEHLSRLSILGELSGTIAHELNQPLAAIGNYARSLIRRLERGRLTAEATAQAALEIANESERAAGILAGIRAFARKRTRIRERHALPVLVEGAVRLFRGMVAGAPAVDIVSHLPADMAPVAVDPLQIQQVLLNLLKNGLDAQRATGRGEQPIGIGLEADDTAGQVVIEVRDHGTGMSAAAMEHLFEPFFTTKADGMGLGLSISKTIVEAHGGTLEARLPGTGPGLIFRLTLPQDFTVAHHDDPD